MVAYLVLFSQKAPANPKFRARQAKTEDQDDKEQAATKKPLKANDSAQLARALETAFERCDYRSVMRHWSALKHFNNAPVVALPHIVESMQRLQKDTPFILRELKGFINALPKERGMLCVNGVLDSLSKRLDSGLMEQIVEMLPEAGLKMDERSYEIFFGMFFTTCSFQEVRNLVSQMKATQVPFTSRSLMPLIKTALKMGEFDEAMQYFREMKCIWNTQGVPSLSSMVPAHVISQLA